MEKAEFDKLKFQKRDKFIHEGKVGELLGLDFSYGDSKVLLFFEKSNGSTRSMWLNYFDVEPYEATV